MVQLFQKIPTAKMPENFLTLALQSECVANLDKNSCLYYYISKQTKLTVIKSKSDQVKTKSNQKERCLCTKSDPRPMPVQGQALGDLHVQKSEPGPMPVLGSGIVKTTQTHLHLYRRVFPPLPTSSAKCLIQEFADSGKWIQGPGRNVSIFR